MATAYAISCKEQGVMGPGMRSALLEVTMVNNYVQNKTLDLSSANANSITCADGGSWLGFSKLDFVGTAKPHTPAGSVGYDVQTTGALGTTTTITFAVLYEDYNAGADGPSIQFPAGALMDNFKFNVLVIGN